MLIEIADVLAQPDAYVCIWRDGELYVRAIADLAARSSEAEPAIAA